MGCPRNRVNSSSSVRRLRGEDPTDATPWIIDITAITRDEVEVSGADRLAGAFSDIHAEVIAIRMPAGTARSNV